MVKKSKNKSKVDNSRIKQSSDKELYAFLATFLSIIGVVIALIARRNDKYVMYYTKQSIVIFLIGLVSSFIGSIFSNIYIIGNIINFALGVLVLIIWLLSWLSALSGEEKEIPVVSELAENIRL
ncbi:MAG: hypothetical protein WC867_04100 [Candidatus Pacearchaeota archaeon]|jgi:uncharacterized membrane protein